MNEAIRLTNKTAVALRRNAVRVRTAHTAAAVIISLLLAAIGVALGIYVHLGIVPAAVALIALIDWAIMIRSRSRYLSLIGQAICTEAAAQEIRAGRSEKTRRARAINDLMGVKADVQRAQNGLEREKAPGARPFFEQEADEEDDDLLPARPVKPKNAPRPAAKSAASMPMRQAAAQTAVHPAVSAAEEESAAPRRRRRAAAQNGSLQLIKNEAK